MRQTIVLIAALVVPIFGVVRTARAELDGKQVAGAIQRGIEYLKREQSSRGTWSDYRDQPGGMTSLCTLALLNSGVSPDDPAMQKALAELRKIKPERVYTVALQTMVFCAAEPKKDMLLIRRNVSWLEEKQLRGDGSSKGSWDYPDRSTGDNSNSQFAVLALHEAERAGVEVSQSTWNLAHQYWRNSQNPDGSWGYKVGHPGTGSMTAAGIAALVITSGTQSQGDADTIGDRAACCQNKKEDNEAAIDKAVAWLSDPRRFTLNANPGNGSMWVYYYLYGLERVGRLTSRRFLGKHDWYREGAEKLVVEQDKFSGFWKGTQAEAILGQDYSTALALLFLSKGRRPVVVAKLKHEPDDDWNRHRNDVANLVTYTERRWEKELTWQVIDIKAAKVEDLLQAPVLYISGSKPLQLSREEIRNLRDYVDRGGFIFAVACCGNRKAFDESFRRTMEEMFPEADYGLRPLRPGEHPIWLAEEEVPLQYAKPLEGIDYGCRTAVVYSPEDISCLWELGRLNRKVKLPEALAAEVAAANSIGVNVLTYATGREPKYKYDVSPTLERDSTGDENDRGTLYLAKLRHPGGCDAAPGALANLVRTAGSNLEIPVATADHLVNITDKELFQYHLVFMHGRNAFRFTPDERKRLRQFVERGGTIFADAICASRPFAESFREEMKAIFPDNPLEPIAITDPLFTSQYGGSDIKTVSRRDPQPRIAGQPLKTSVRQVEPSLEVLKTEGRYGVIFSPYDISCALEKHESLQCNGYVREDAAKIGLNVLLYSLHE